MKAGQEVTLAHDKKGYAIHEPLFGKLLLPRDERPVEILMLPLGSKLFWTDDRLDAWIERVGNGAAKTLHPKGEPIRMDLGEYIRKLGREYGFTEAEVRREIRSWIESAKKRKSSLRAQALANYAEGNFDLAAKMALKWAEAVDGEAARAYSLAGDAFGRGPKPQYGAAIAAYEKALSRVDRSREEKAWWDISFKLAGARAEFAISAEPRQASLALRRAVAIYWELLKATDRKTQTQRWAMIQNDRGDALRHQAGLVEGREAAHLLAQAVDAHHAAREVCTKERTPSEGATSQNNLGAVLRKQAKLAEPKEAARLLAQAVDAYHAAHEVFTRDDMPQEWAKVERNLEHALESLQNLKKQAPPPRDNMAHLLVLVPENAELWFNGTKTKQTGSERECVSPVLTPGKSYSYELKAKWTENGKTEEQTRTVRVQANTRQRIDFTKAEPPADKKN